MSFMTLRGHRYHCVACRHQTTVEYRDGARATQVSHPIIDKQDEIRKDLGILQEDAYFYSLVLCEGCFEQERRRLGERIKEKSLLQKLEELIDRVDQGIRDDPCFRAIVHKIIRGKVLKLSPEKLQLIAPRDADGISTDRHHAENRPEIQQWFLDEVASDSGFAPAMANLQRIAAAIKAFQETAEALRDGVYFEVLRVPAIDHLNPYLMGRDTFRTPAAGTPRATFFVRKELDIDGLLASLPRGWDHVGSLDLAAEIACHLAAQFQAYEGGG
jgi:hypothetical protein